MDGIQVADVDNVGLGDESLGARDLRLMLGSSVNDKCCAAP
jgi:hypothetical protein